MGGSEITRTFLLLLVAVLSCGTAHAACTEDTFSCSAWSLCSRDGVQNRTCMLDTDCVDVHSPLPATTQPCLYTSSSLPRLQCTNYHYIGDRISCRMHLNDSHIVPELGVAFLPERCRTLQGDRSKEDCAREDGRFTACAQLPFGLRRTQCARDILGISNFTRSMESCMITNASSNTTAYDLICIDSLRKKSLNMTLFRIDDLIARATFLYRERRLSQNAAVKYIAELEKMKEQFQQRQTIGERQGVLIQTRKLWHELQPNIAPEGSP